MSRAESDGQFDIPKETDPFDHGTSSSAAEALPTVRTAGVEASEAIFNAIARFEDDQKEMKQLIQTYRNQFAPRLNNITMQPAAQTGCPTTVDTKAEPATELSFEQSIRRLTTLFRDILPPSLASQLFSDDDSDSDDDVPPLLENSLTTSTVTDMQDP